MITQCTNLLTLKAFSNTKRPNKEWKYQRGNGTETAEAEVKIHEHSFSGMSNVTHALIFSATTYFWA